MNLSASSTLFEMIQFFRELNQGLGSQGVWSIVIEPVIKSYKGQNFPRRQSDVVDVGIGYNLVVSQDAGVLLHYLPLYWAFSQITVPPIPRPMHMVVIPYRTCGCSSKCLANWFISLTPDDASG